MYKSELNSTEIRQATANASGNTAARMRSLRNGVAGTFLAVVLSFSAATTQAQSHPPLGGGTGTSSSDPYLITTPAHLDSLAIYVNADSANGNSTAGVFYRLENDLDLSGYSSGTGWTPIGYCNSSSDYSYFQGHFDGNGKVVQNLSINRPSQDVVGLFGYTRNATIKNLGVENCNVIGHNNVGGLVGYNDGMNSGNTTIENCYATGDVTGNYSVGGLVGINDGYNSGNATIKNCYATGDVTGNYSVGGLVGFNDGYYNNGNATIENCYASGEVTGNNCVGGLVGINDGSYSGIATIKNCYATGTVTGDGDDVGGLVGINDGSNSGTATIENCYASGEVTGNNCVGGLVGFNDGSNSGNATITNCVAANASITATGAFINRILGYNYNGTLTNNYALETMLVNGSTVTGGTLNDEGGADATLAELHSLSFYNTAGNWDTDAWDIDDPIGVWNICDGDGMPFLRWQKNILCSNEHLIIATAGANGSISPSGNVIVNTGDAQTFTFTPDSGYEIDEILIDGSAISTANSYTFTDVKEDHTIHVTFKADVGIANVEAYGIRPHVYPNPTTGKFTIYDLRLDDLKLEIYDVVGQVVGTYRIRPTKDETVIDISHLATGLYFLKTDGKTVKVVKE